ncbi:unnamed protein product [Ostreobium quekettii]|uniref:Uncharacterized protein n=1 Tax=Ostreobium quekettii TaxID=121088 RepID=A0A8S1JCU8_9CHLO|nr:unnamed protein product [Ostreobium quekettii]|eukprot:evm.model.scf_994EXC.1 EVM.evm.TU.scf_994EXC.1   scf_994EXC:1583-2668(-)
MPGPLQLSVAAPRLDSLQAAGGNMGIHALGDGRKVSPSDIQLVQNLIERCLQAYMPKLEVVSTLQAQANVEPRFTTLVWQQLERENPEFFWAYYLRLKVKDQIVMFNHLLEQQLQMVQKLQRRAAPPVASIPGEEITAVQPFGTVQMSMEGQRMGGGSQLGQRSGGLLQANGVCLPASSVPGTLGQVTNGVTGISKRDLAQQGQVSNCLLGGGVVPSSAPLLPVPDLPSALPGTEPHGLSGSLALSSPMDLDFDSNLLANCWPSPDLGLPGVTTDFMLSERDMQGAGTGLANDLQEMAQSFSYPDLASLDLQVAPYIDTDGVGLGAANMCDLPRIGSLSDMMALDLEALDKLEPHCPANGL